MSEPTRQRDLLASYPDALRRSIEAQAAELKAKQRAGEMPTGPWVPTTKLGRRKRVKAPTKVARILRRA